MARMLGVWLNAWPPNPGIDRAVFQNARFGPRLQPLKQDVVGDIGTALWVVMGTLGLLLLIACANVANLLLVRAEAPAGARDSRRARRRPGTDRAMLVESITLGVLGGALGLGGVRCGSWSRKVRDTLPRLREIGIDPLVLSFAFGCRCSRASCSVIIPIVKYAGPRIATALRGSAERSAMIASATERVASLVVVQVALALVLLIGSLDDPHVSALAQRAAGIHAPEEIQYMP